MVLEKFNITRPEKEEGMFTGYVMYLDDPVVSIVNNEVVEILSAKAPLHFLAKGRFESWMESRLIDNHRANSRRIRRRLSLVNVDDISTVLSVHASSLVDQFWVKRKGEKITYFDSHNFNDAVSNTALYGDLVSYDLSNGLSPEITNIGSFEKCWKMLYGNWYLVKKGNENQNFSEILASKLGVILGFNVVHYSIFDNNTHYIKCLNFVNKPYNFEPMYSLIGEGEEEDALNAMKKLNIDCSDFLDIMFLDSIICNTDRHAFNYGLISDGQGNYSIAPYFDNNLALLATPGSWDKVNSNIGFTEILHRILKDNNYPKPKLDMNVLYKLIRSVYYDFSEIEKDVDFIYEFIKLRYEMY